MAANSSPSETKTTSLGTVIEGARRTKSFFSASIYRVPTQLRNVEPRAYTPRLIFIGPFHKHLETPQAQDLKLWYVNSFLSRMADRSTSITTHKEYVLKKCNEGMTKDLIDRAKKHYAEEVGDKLTAEMLVVDGCFILEILCRYKIKRDEEKNNEQPTSSCSPQPTEQRIVSSGKEMNSNEQPTGDPIFDSPLIYHTVRIDLLLLENQIPFFVLEKLFSLTLGQEENPPPSVLIPDYIIPYFHNVMVPVCCKSTDTGVKTCCRVPKDCVVSIVSGRTDGKENENHHILQILHDHKLPKKRECNNEECFVPSASELAYSGVKFLASSGQDLCEIDFEDEGQFSWFRRAEFRIPQLPIDDTTELVLRNLIAFEQCHPNASSRYFTSYAFLMDKLVSSEKDVEVLEKAKVILDNLGSKKDVCDLLNNIAKEIVLEDFFFAEKCKIAGAYSGRRWSQFKA